MMLEQNSKLRVLVAIANHGIKNQRFLDQLLAEYQTMNRHKVDIVVLSDVLKDLGPRVEVKVGLPIMDPWSLPFGYKELFARHIDNYDLFIYSEDDVLITERHIEAFVQTTEVLPANYISGFMRFEVSPEGKEAFPDMHSHYHWDPNSVVRFGNHLFAYHTNEHAACFMLTRGQLCKAIESGGFMLPPRRGTYDMLVTAATDPYRECGLKKLICISRFNEFCLHHLPNAYLGKLGLDAELAKREIAMLSVLVDQSGLPRGPLFDPYPLRDGDGWIKIYYEGRRDDVLKYVPANVQRVLSVGCGCGTTEEVLVMRGVDVVGVPLDSVIGVTAASKGIKVTTPDFDIAVKDLEGQLFDCIFMIDILQQLRDPVAIIEKFRKVLRYGGTLLVSAPNWNYIGTLRQRATGRGREALVWRASLRSEGVHRTTKGLVSGWIGQGGYRQIKQLGVVKPRFAKISKWSFGLADKFLCQKLLSSARRERDWTQTDYEA